MLIAPGDGNNTAIASGEKQNLSISIGTSSGDTIKIETENITFNIGSQSYSLIGIFQMIHELDCRTTALKTTIARSDVTHDLLTAKKFALTTNLLTDDVTE